MASKALTENLVIRVSKPMLDNFDHLAKSHGVKTARLVRAALWIFLAGNNAYEVDENGDVIIEQNREGKKVPKRLALGRMSGGFWRQDEELIVYLRLLDGLDGGGVGYSYDDPRRFEPIGDDGDPKA